MKNIHILPTENSSRLSYNKDGVLELHRLQWRKNTQNIYITSNEIGKHGEYVYWEKDTERPIKFQRGEYLGAKKIILTTDQDLIKDGVQSIDDEFLEWFVKNPNCEEVEIEEIHYSDTDRYEIIIPKEEAFKHKVEVLSKEEILENRSNAYEFIDFDEIEKQIAITETRGEKVVKYLDKYKGQSIYNEIALAIEFGYQLKLEEDE